MTVENYGQEPTLIWSLQVGACLCACSIQVVSGVVFVTQQGFVFVLQVLSDFTVISGDSLGHVQVWDGGIGTLRQSFAMHEADVLSVQVSSDQKHFYATGIDSKIVQFSSVEEDGEGVGMLPKRWVSTKSRRYHTHDIVSMTVVSDSNGDELVIAGGVDTQLRYRRHFSCVNLIFAFRRGSFFQAFADYLRAILPNPYTPVICGPRIFATCVAKSKSFCPSAKTQCAVLLGPKWLP